MLPRTSKDGESALSTEALERGFFERIPVDTLVWLVYGLVVAWLVLPLQRFPSQDGPAHVYQAKLLRELLFNGDSIDRRYFVLSNYPEPNVACHVMLASLMTLATPEWAEKLLVFAYLVLFPLAVRYATGKAAGAWVMVWLLPLAPGFTLHMGFYNFCLGVLLLLFIIGYWQRRLAQPTGRLGLAWLLLLLYFCHPMALAACYLLLGLITVCSVSRQPKGSLAKRVGPLILASVPSGLLLLGYLLHQPGSEIKWHDPREGVRQSAYVAGLWSYTFAEMRCMQLYVFASLVIALMLFMRRASMNGAGWLLGSLVFLVGSVLAPDAMAGGSLVRERFQLLAVLCLPIGVSQCLDGNAHGGFVGSARILGATVAGIQLWLLAGVYQRLETHDWSELSSLDSLVRPKQTLLTVHLRPNLNDERGNPISVNVDAFRHAASYLCIRRHLVMLDHYAGHVPGFQVRLRPEYDPFLILGEKEMQPPANPDLRRYVARTGTHINNVLVWGAPGPEADPILYKRYRFMLEPEYASSRPGKSPGLEFWQRPK